MKWLLPILAAVVVVIGIYAAVYGYLVATGPRM